MPYSDLSKRETLKRFRADLRKSYAILSHRWEGFSVAFVHVER